MNAGQGKVVSAVALAIAAISVSWAVIKWVEGKTEIAQKEAAAAQDKADKQRNEARTAQAALDANAKSAEAAEKRRLAAEKEAEAAESNRLAKEAEAVAAEENRKAVEAKAAADVKIAEDNLKTKQAERAKTADLAEAERAKSAAADAAVSLAKVAAEQDRAKARAEEKERADKLRLEELAAEQVRNRLAIANAEADKVRLKYDELLELERRLLEFKNELDERDLATRPELTIKDLETTSGDEQASDDKQPLLPENDVTLPVETRTLAKTEREMAERESARRERVRSAVVNRLERLYVEAVREDRVTDAEYFRRELKRLYPDWTYKPPKQEDQEKKEEPNT